MMFRKYAIPAIALLLYGAATARAMELPHLGISGSARACCCAEITRSVLPAYNAELYACMRVANSNDKVRVVFTWYAPDGTVYSSTVKVGFPTGNDEDIKVWDGVNPGGMEGWWRIEAKTGGEMLSKRLLLTRNRQILTVLDGNKDARIRVLRNANLLKPEGEDTVVIAMEDPEPEVRAAAVTVVRGLAEPWAADIVRRGLSDTGHGVRLAAARLAGMLPESEREAACLPLVGDQDPEMRLAALAGLKGLGGAKAADAFVGALDDPVAAVRLEALRELALHGGPRIAEALPRLAADPDRDVARAAVDAAVSLDESGLRSDALVAAAQGPHRDIARSAVDMLIKYKDPRASGAYMKQFMEGYRRQDILDAVGAVRGTGAVGPLAGIYRNSSGDDGTRLGAVQYLAGRGPSALPVLKEALADRNPAVSLAAVNAMGTAGDTPDRTEALRGALKSANPPVRRAALDILSGSALPESALAVVDALKDIELRADALEYVARSKDGRVISALADAASHVPDAGFRARVVRVLSGVGIPLAGLARFLPDQSPDVRLEAVKGLAAMRDGEAAYELLLAGGDTDAAVREEALLGLQSVDEAGLTGAADLAFDREEASPRVIGFIGGRLRSKGVSLHVAKLLKPDDNADISALVGPIMDRPEEGDGAVLTEALKSTDSELRADVLSAMTMLSPDAAGNAFKDAYARYPELRHDIVEASVRAGAGKDVLPLALSDGDADTRLLAARSLKGEPRGSVAGLVMGALEDENPGVRLLAAEAAAAGGVVDALVAASKDGSPEVRTAAAKGLGGSSGDLACDTLAALALDPDEGVSGAALGALEGLGWAACGRVWLRLGSPDAPKPARLASLKALNGEADGGAGEVFAEALSDKDGEVADAGAAGLAAMGDAALPYLHAMLKSPRARMRVLGIISGIGSPESEGPAIASLDGLEGAELAATVNALGKVGGEGSLGPLREVYARGGYEVKVVVLKAVSGMKLSGGEDEVLSMVSEGLSSTDDGVRFYAARAAGELGVSGVRALIREKMDVERSPLVKDEMSRTLGRI